MKISFCRLFRMPQALFFSEKEHFSNFMTLNNSLLIKYWCFSCRNQEFSLLSKALISVLARTPKSYVFYEQFSQGLSRHHLGPGSASGPKLCNYIWPSICKQPHCWGIIYEISIHLCLCSSDDVVFPDLCCSCVSACSFCSLNMLLTCRVLTSIWKSTHSSGEESIRFRGVPLSKKTHICCAKVPSKTDRKAATFDQHIKPNDHLSGQIFKNTM